MWVFLIVILLYDDLSSTYSVFQRSAIVFVMMKKVYLFYSYQGIESEISYIRDGKENTNAINYNLPIPFDVDKVVFTWQNFLGPFHLRQSEVRSKLLSSFIYCFVFYPTSAEFICKLYFE